MNNGPIITAIFSHTFVFLFGLILGAVGELLWNRRAAKDSKPQDEDNLQRIEIPRINVDVPGNAPVPAAPMPLAPAAPIRPAAPVPVVPAKGAKDAPKVEVKTLSIVEQVDEILDEIQKASPGSQPNVSLVDDGKGGVLVKVDNQSYPGIDAVPDEQVQGLIRKAVAEWERRSSRK